MKIPNFDESQIAYLEYVFREQTTMPNSGANELFYRLGQRDVIQHIKQIRENAKRQITT